MISLPPEYQREFSKLQDAAPKVPIETVREMITAELGQPLEHSFASFDATPLAAASIGQAHLATLQDGTEVIVKVRRPGAAEQVDEDLKLLHSLASTASHRSGGSLTSMTSSGWCRSLTRACERNWTICMKDIMPSASPGTLQPRALLDSTDVLGDNT